MKVSVWDTYVKRENSLMAHFDILVSSTTTNKSKIIEFGTRYLDSKSIKYKQFSSEECQFCHIEEATEQIIESIKNKGYAIIEMENCS